VDADFAAGSQLCARFFLAADPSRPRRTAAPRQIG
jgi:hypothetical protein